MRKKGSFTIEAAIIIPILMFVVMLVIQLSFFLYNRHAITVMASQAALYGVQMETEGKPMIEKELHSFLKEETESRLLFTESADWNVKVTMAKVRVTVCFMQKTWFKKISCEASEEKNRLVPAIFLWEKERWSEK